MTTEKYDPWALLREARESVFRDSLCREYDDSHKAAAMEEHRRRTRLLDRIDAALAERQDSATDVVEPETPVHDTETCCCVDCCFARTKTAAIAAARGL